MGVFLARLVSAGDTTVSRDALVEAIWNGEARSPNTFDSTLRNLRALLGGARYVDRYSDGRENRYRLKLANPGDLDVNRFESLVRRASSIQDEASRSAVLAEALALWRGRVLEGFEEKAFVADFARRLDAMRRTAVLEKAEIDLRLGRRDDVLQALGGLPVDLQRDPHVLALLGRATRRALAAPHITGLRHEPAGPSGEAPALGANNPPAARGGRYHRTFLRPQADLIGRNEALTAAESAVLSALRSGRHAVLPVTGSAGVGKSAFAQRLAWLLRDSFPGGCAYLHLASPSTGARVDPSRLQLDVLTRLLGGPGEGTGPGGRDLDQVYAERLDPGSRLLLVLDDAVDAQQVHRLVLPGGMASALVVSRQPVGGLNVGLPPVELAALTAEAARELLGESIGTGRVDAEPAQAAQLVDLCVRTPLFIELAAARVMVDRCSLADAVAALRSAPMDFLHDGRTEAGAVLSYGLGADQDARTALSRIGRLEATTLDEPAAAALIGTPEAPQVLSLLSRVGLLLRSTDVIGHRVVALTHGLVRDYARHQVFDRRGWAAALDRFGRSTLAEIEAVLTVLEPGGIRPSGTPVSGPPPSAGAPVGAWFDQRRDGTVEFVRQAVVEQRWDIAWRLAVAMAPFFEMRAETTRWEELDVLATRAATASASRRARAWVLLGTAELRRYQGRLDDSVRAFETAELLFRRSHDPAGRALALCGAGDVRAGIGMSTPGEGGDALLVEAARMVARSRALFESLGRAAGHALALERLGQIEALRADRTAGARSRTLLRRAGELLRSSRELYTDLGNRRREAELLRMAAIVQGKLGRTDEAIRDLHRTAALFADIDDPRGEATALLSLGVIHHRADPRSGDALHALERAEAIFSDLGDVFWRATAERHLGAALVDNDRRVEGRELLLRASARFSRLNMANEAAESHRLAQSS